MPVCSYKFSWNILQSLQLITNLYFVGRQSCEDISCAVNHFDYWILRYLRYGEKGEVEPG